MEGNFEMKFLLEVDGGCCTFSKGFGEIGIIELRLERFNEKGLILLVNKMKKLNL